MGFFFNTPKPSVKESEWAKVRTSLFNRGFKNKEISEVEKFFQGSMNEANARDRGIQREEIDQAVAWLRANPTKHRFTSEKIENIEEALKMRL